MAGYMTSAVVSAHLNALAAAHPTFVTRSGPADWKPGRAGATSGYVKVGATTSGSPASRWGVLLIGGIHARELAPPDALVSFLEKLATAYAASSAITYPAWTDPVGGIVYDSFTVPWPWVRQVVESLDLYVAPLVNPDGRDFVLTPLPSSAPLAEQELHKGWRKNRRPAPVGNADLHAVGVDLNRNFDITWDFTTFFDVAKADVHSSTDPANDTFIGPTADGAEAEPETKNVAGLMRNKNISFFIDFHAYSRDVLYCWGIDTNQSTNASKTFTNRTDWDHKRDGTLNMAYEEYIPKATDAAQQAMAQRISDVVFAKAGGSDPRAQARSRYTVMSSAHLYVTSGTSQDYCFSRWFTAAIAGSPIRPVMAFTVEVGGDPKLGPDHDEGGFTPDYIKHYPKLEREIHVAAWAFLTAVAATGVVPPYAPPPPPPSSGGTLCLITTLFLGAGLHRDVLFLRDVRDRQLPASAVGRLLAAAIVGIYRRVGPVLADRLRPHPTTRRVVRDGLLHPFVAMLRLTSTRLRRRPRARAQALAALIVLASPVLAAGLALAGLSARLASLRPRPGARR
jgi:murein tripeptide amidase MpaA